MPTPDERREQAEADIGGMSPPAADDPDWNSPEDACYDEPELTAEEARALADDLSLQLYRAQDALGFVEECCVIAEREGRTITAADVRKWLKGAQCGRQLAAEPGFVADPTAPPMHFVTWVGRLNNGEQSPRTTADNSLTSSDTADNPLRDQLQAAIESEMYEYRERTMWWPEGEITKEIARLATRGVMEIRDHELEQLRTKVAEFDHIINWHTTCASCARILNSAYQETVRAETAERQRDRLADALREVLDQTPALSVSKADVKRWRAILDQPQEQP